MSQDQYHTLHLSLMRKNPFSTSCSPLSVGRIESRIKSSQDRDCEKSNTYIRTNKFNHCKEKSWVETPPAQGVFALVLTLPRPRVWNYQGRYSPVNGRFPYGPNSLMVLARMIRVNLHPRSHTYNAMWKVVNLCFSY